MAPRILWRWAAAVLGVTAWLVVRACGYDFAAAARYFGYVGLYVVLPGTVALYGVKRGPISFPQLLALAVPTGFALEIFSFLGLSALGAKPLYVWSPLLWAGLGLAIRRARGEWPARLHVSGHHAGLALGLAVAFLATAVMAASQMFAESPLAGGLPTRAIFHDWVYLVSRAGVIKNHWPLDDPSLSGTPLQYHYFMMVHAAAASWTTGVEITAVMLRLIEVPLGAVLVMQAFMLGRMTGRSAWGGVLAALLMVMASEVSLAPSYGQPMFLGLFARWLFVSPTFFFGMIFCGALLLGLVQCTRLARCGLRHYAWLLLLATAGTGAKGTLVPVLVCAVGLLVLWRGWRERRVPWRFVLFGVCLGAAFAMVYLPTMSAWRTGDAAWRPFHVFQLTEFWKEHLPTWTRALAHWLPKPVALNLASVLCGALVFCGTCGVRLLAIPYLLWGDSEKRDATSVRWLGAFFLACVGMGLLMELNSYGELYIVLMMRLPMSVLTAAFFVSAARRVHGWWRILKEAPASTSASPFAPEISLRGTNQRAHPAPAWLPRTVVAMGALILLGSLALQTSLWVVRNHEGLREWLKTPTDLKPDGYMRELQEALLWVRANTEPNAVLVANACTPENMQHDHWGALDRTLTGVHFYYSALSERRLWFEGPNYVMDTSRARLRANLESAFFYHGRSLTPQIVNNNGPAYALVDHSLADGAKVADACARRVFSNARIDVYRLVEPLKSTLVASGDDGGR